MSPKRSYKVIVIGAGVSGISAAHHLALNGLRDVLVLEARDRLGGRVHSMKNDLGPLELGAQWIQGGCPANSMYNLANRYFWFLVSPEILDLALANSDH